MEGIMNSVGVFLEEEINGEPFHIFSLLPQTDSSSSSSSPSLSGEEAIDSDSDPSRQTRFFCPDFRREADYRLNLVEYHSVGGIVTFSTSPRFNKGTVDQLDQLYLVAAHVLSAFNCKHPVLPLFWCNNEKPNLHCPACEKTAFGSGYYYFCERCKDVFHKECVEAPVFIKHHPSHPSLSLQLCYGERQFWSCMVCETQIGNKLAYYCQTYKASLHLICALKPIPIIIDHFKRHPHPLTFFPKQASLACNICGVIKELIPTYICARCVFVVHRDCIYFPYVIRICRHHHRISFTYSLPSRELSCGVCRRNVDNSCGAYSCNTCDNYFVHTRCALRRDLWDGEELEGVPEEIEIVEDPFKMVADGEIIHFSHGHQLKLEICRVYDEDKCCQACLLPIYEGYYYSCVDDGHCDFILHETCANAPRKIHHPLHAHPLTLKVVTDEYNENQGFFWCSACRRACNGFVYEESATDEDCFRLDVRCASISEPFKYEGHEHPLFLALSPGEEEGAKCHICHDHNYSGRLRKLNCIECDLIICFLCATLPYKAKYKHDKHFITFQKELVETHQSDWCEACEEKIVNSGEGGFYACDEYCCTTLHVDCLLGKDPYLKPDLSISPFRTKYHILRNNTMSRPLCPGHRCCKKRCPHRVFFQRKHLTFCSFSCVSFHSAVLHFC